MNQLEKAAMDFVAARTKSAMAEDAVLEADRKLSAAMAEEKSAYCAVKAAWDAATLVTAQVGDAPAWDLDSMIEAASLAAKAALAVNEELRQKKARAEDLYNEVTRLTALKKEADREVSAAAEALSAEATATSSAAG